ncbi:MAG: 23S rRNA (adenine(2503)-C(2))-methyltransferase RlmN [Deltaproteobacteria bacterium]|nr:23S rRNA (adenine(2503)-C(2))-methyltransferase RlmN [Deltaproteobacteria bacterium]
MSEQTGTLDLRGLGRQALTDFLVERLGMPRYRGDQLFQWLHFRRQPEFGAMTNLPADLRERLEELDPPRPLTLDRTHCSSDGTMKFAFRTHDGHLIESVYIPEWDREERAAGAAGEVPPTRKTLCVSSQVGCAMGCAFCMTATLGLVRQLSASEIVAQVHAVNDLLVEEGLKGPRPLTNLVFMGMGEPLHNYEALKSALDVLLDPMGPDFSHRHVTVSTAGLVPQLERLGRETEVKVALSLTGTTDEVRDHLMPLNRRWPLAEVIRTCRNLPTRRGRRVTIEYVLLAGVTDELEDADRLADLLADLPAKVNLIAFNEVEPGVGDDGHSGPFMFRRPGDDRIEAFRARLERRGLTAVIRRSRGRDIDAACGQLAARG